MKVSATGDTSETQQDVATMVNLVREIVTGLVYSINGYIMLAAFAAAFEEMKEVHKHAQGSDKKLIEELIFAVIGSFGKTIQ